MKRIKFLLAFLIPFISYSQEQSPQQIELNLFNTANKLHSLRYASDSTEKFSVELKKRTIDLLSKNPATIKYPFKMLIDSNAFEIVTSEDSLFRIYSWDTWTGGTMHFYNIIYQFSSKGKVYTEPLVLEEGDGGAFYSDIFILKTGTKTYYLAVSNATFSSKDADQSIEIFSIENGELKKNVKLIKTSGGMTGSISVEFDFFSVVERPERPLKLIKFDKNKKIIYIPVVYEDGKVTDKFIQYKFNGNYFEKYKIQ